MGIHGFFQCMWRWYPDVVHHLPLREDILDVECAEDFSHHATHGRAREGSPQEHADDAEPEGHGDAGEGGENARRSKKRRVRRYDNLYLDMNGLIHPCCHDTAPLPEPQSEEEMFFRVFQQLELLFDYVRPRKCLFMAVDGVAPRSKMNQQRARRFRAAQERLENDVMMNEVAAMMREDYPELPPPSFREKWDHNVITPSTAFMERMSQAIEWFIHFKMNTDRRWRRILIVFSDSHVPGEGEHKIMHYIRGLRAQPGYDPQTSHCIHGQDADLICLALATHEPHFAILRNEVDEKFQTVNDRFCYFDITQYREKLRHDFSNIPNMDLERVLDDIVFMCFFVGNDFLPHIPMVHIKTEGLEMLFDHYVRDFQNHYYLTKGGEINFKRLQKFLKGFQDNYMAKLVAKKARMHFSNDFALRRMGEQVQDKNDGIQATLEALENHELDPQEASNQLLKYNAAIIRISESCVAGKHPLQFTYGEEHYRDQYYRFKLGWEYQTAEENRAEDAEREVMRSDMKRAAGQRGRGRGGRGRGEGRGADAAAAGDAAKDCGRGTRDRARAVAPPSDSSSKTRKVFESKIRRLAREYLVGLQWVMRYYTTGCPSWSWFYPYYYAPLLEDLISACTAEKLNLDMVLGEPLHPVEQLLAVLPRESVSALPEELHAAVMDPQSVLASFYPVDIDIDFSEASQAYQGVIKLPFIDCERLREAVRTLIDLRPDDGSALLFVHKEHPLARELGKVVQPLAHAAELAPHAAQATSFVPIPVHIQRYAPIAGRVGVYDMAFPLSARITCPDSGIARAMADTFGRPIESNEVRGFTYELRTHADYQPQLLEGALVDNRKARSKPERHRRGVINSGPAKRRREGAEVEQEERGPREPKKKEEEENVEPPPLLGVLDPALLSTPEGNGESAESEKTSTKQRSSRNLGDENVPNRSTSSSKPREADVKKASRRLAVPAASAAPATVEDGAAPSRKSKR